MDNIETFGQKVFIELQTKSENFVFELERAERPDVARVFGNAMYQFAGVAGPIYSSSFVDIDVLRARLIIKIDDSYYTSPW
ncbi:hypothetical protein AGMMS50276_11530 [Synergistales bacterium]|nr:hypothetical protein AGMMS50276_11530 [Synergistales bacterium]